jgi:hypothetical protein
MRVAQAGPSRAAPAIRHFQLRIEVVGDGQVRIELERTVQRGLGADIAI